MQITQSNTTSWLWFDAVRSPRPSKAQARMQARMQYMDAPYGYAPLSDAYDGDSELASYVKMLHLNAVSMHASDFNSQAEYAEFVKCLHQKFWPAHWSEQDSVDYANYVWNLFPNRSPHYGKPNVHKYAKNRDGYVRNFIRSLDTTFDEEKRKQKTQQALDEWYAHWKDGVVDA